MKPEIRWKTEKYVDSVGKADEEQTIGIGKQAIR